jgi:hypothetical protein
MAGIAAEVKIEAMLKKEVRQVQQKIKELKRLESESTEFDMNTYIRLRELRAYVNNYRIALQNMKRYGKSYIGHKIEDDWLSNLTTIETEVFKARYCDELSFEEIQAEFGDKLQGKEPQKVYDAAYKKVMCALISNS